MACEKCYQQYFSTCGEDITFSLGLDPDTAYTLIVKSVLNGRQYIYPTTTDAQGDIVWAAANQPTGLFVPHSGAYTMTIEDEQGDPVTFTIGMEDYGCVVFEFIPSVTITI